LRIGASTYAATVRLPGRGRSLLEAAAADLRALRRYGPLIRALTRSSLRTENVGTILGSVWWLLHPLLLVVAYYILIHVMLRVHVPYFPLYILSSVLAWKFFQAGTRNAVWVTLSKEAQMRQIAFPKIVLPISTLLAESARLGMGMLVVVVAAMGWGLYPDAKTPLLLIVFAVQFVFTLALAIFFSALNFFFRDVGNIIDYTFPIWFYLSPGLYTLASVPHKYMSVYLLNPFATILPAYHSVLIDQAMPNFARLGILFGVSCALLAFAYLFFVRVQSAFAKVN
jgi:homopolymeric O-antigen transport system permease protein